MRHPLLNASAGTAPAAPVADLWRSRPNRSLLCSPDVAV